jgi:hypothetical protein
MEVLDLVPEILGDGGVIFGDEDLRFAKRANLGAGKFVLQRQHGTAVIHTFERALLVPIIHQKRV